MALPNFQVEEVGPQGWGVSNKLNTPPFNVVGGIHNNQGFSLQAIFTRGGIHTLTFGLNAAVPSDSPMLLRAVAEITWSVAGQSVTRTAHVGSGTSISGIGEAVTCRLRDDTILAPDAIEPYPASLTYLATIVATAGVRPPSQNQPFYAPAANQNFKFQAGDPETVIDIPDNIGVNSFYISPQGAVDPTLILLKGYPNVASWDGSALGKWIPLIPGLRRLSVQNTMPTDFYGSLLFGIDG